MDDWADLRAERAPAGRIYTQEQPRRRDVAVSLLLDASGSTESWLSGHQRVIDVVKEAALVFSEALATLGDRFALQAFSGQRATDVRVRVLKGFNEPPGQTVQRRIGALEPDAFTRLGGALRHATAGLARERTRVRLLLVLSDGKPQDEDGYEGTYGIEDVRQAVAEALLQGVHVFGVTVDREGAAYLPRLFGPHGYTVIWNAEAGGSYLLRAVLGDAKPAPGPAPRSRISKSQSLGTSWLTLEVSDWYAEVERVDSVQALGEPVLEQRAAWERYERVRQ